MIQRSKKNNPLIIKDPNFNLHKHKPKPEFMLIGGAKCGTTSFSSYLPAHPQIKQCTPKEPNYWTWSRCTRDQYQSLFVNVKPVRSLGANQQIGGEYSTSSLLHPLVPRRVRGQLPKIKIIVLLRNPIDRAYSHFIMSQRGGLEPNRSFDEIVRKEIEEVPELLEAHQRGFSDPSRQTSAHRSTAEGSPILVAQHNPKWELLPLITEEELFRFYFTSYIFRSLYHDQLWRWFQLFPRGQIKIIEAPSLMNNRKKTMNEVVKFLGLKPYDFSDNDLGKTWGGGASNFKPPGDYTGMASETRAMLSEFFSPHNEKLFELIGERYDWD